MVEGKEGKYIQMNTGSEKRKKRAEYIYVLLQITHTKYIVVQTVRRNEYISYAGGWNNQSVSGVGIMKFVILNSLE